MNRLSGRGGGGDGKGRGGEGKEEEGAEIMKIRMKYNSGCFFHISCDF